MKTETLKKIGWIVILYIIGNVSIIAQNRDVLLEQDERFTTLLNEKRKINSSIILNDKYKIQIFTGDKDGSKKALTTFREANKKTDCTIVFNTPSYKVWVGSYKTRIDAEKKLKELKKTYPIAFLVKPNK